MEINAAELRTTLQIQRKRNAPKDQDDWSETPDTGARIGSLKAKIEENGGDERSLSGTRTAIRRYKITARFRRGLCTTDRLCDPVDKVTYNIESLANHKQENRWLVITAVRTDGKN